ncbi:MAG: hypothetical protein M1826_001098 [Phylliscum demangeonii]|nr:MAG: hypothetical protein M1826_001098 [Phylliscum demangeonii]
MKKYIPPKRLGEHRVAAIALYRALLGEWAATWLPLERQWALRRVVRNTFRKNKNVQSTPSLKQGFQAGYEALDVLRAAASGDHASQSRILELMGKLAPPKAFRPAVQISPKVAHTSPSAASSSSPSTVAKVKHRHRILVPWPGATPVLDRPYLKISGRRQVPKLVAASGFPFLRLKKPQSPYLTRVITQKIKQKNKRHVALMNLEGVVLSEAQMEDCWESQLLQNPDYADQVRRSGGHLSVEPRWTAAVEVGIGHLNNVLATDEMKRLEMAKKMLAIVDAEQALADKEMREGGLPPLPRRSTGKRGRESLRRRRLLEEGEPSSTVPADG